MMMMLNSGSGSVLAVTCWRRRRVTCFAASNPTTEYLRAQLEQLHTEAESARAKANNARMRLMRLSEAAENLRRQAAISVRIGKEEDARELLFQKKKVMEALQKSKARIELLDELSSKLHEAISLKERQLIGNVASDLGVVREDSSSSVRIVSPVTEATKIESDELGSHDHRPEEDQELESGPDSLEASLVGITSLMGEEENSSKSEASFGVFLDHIDEQLSGIESELVTVLRVSALVLDGDYKTKNFKVQQTMELLESIHVIRQRIANLRLVEVERK